MFDVGDLVRIKNDGGYFGSILEGKIGIVIGKENYRRVRVKIPKLEGIWNVAGYEVEKIELE